MLYGYAGDLESWEDLRCKWDGDEASFIEVWGEKPDPGDYMPDWTDDQATHYQMYENVSEGTPISPVMDSPESLARWLAENGASAGPFATAGYHAWLKTILAGSAPSMVIGDGFMMSGVEWVGTRDVRDAE